MTYARATPGHWWAIIAFVCFVIAPTTRAGADGGAVRLREKAGAYQITVFTLPTPFRAGPVDVNVLVQDSVTGEYIPRARVEIRLTSRETGRTVISAATEENATNKLLRAALLELPAAGWWDVDVDVDVDGPQGSARVRFEIEAADHLPRWRELWLWFMWPAFVVVVFALHQSLARRRNPLRREPLTSAIPAVGANSASADSPEAVPASSSAR